jgi:hypothetical protein
MSISPVHWRYVLSYLLLLLFAAYTILPVLRYPATCLPAQQSMLMTVPLFNAWTIWWNADRLSEGLEGYWDAPIFFPTSGAFAFSEPQPATMVVAPVLWCSGSPALAYNTYLLLSLFLNGLFTFRLLRRTGSPVSLALIGGFMMIWLPLSVRQIDVLQMVPVWPMLWVWDAARRHGQTNSIPHACELALAYIICLCSSIHHSLFLIVVLSGTVWILWSNIKQRNFVISVSISVTIVAMFCWVLIWPMQLHLKGHNFDRVRDVVEQGSARPADYLNTPRDALFFSGSAVRMGLSPGWFKTLLGLLGVILGIRRRRRRWWALFLISTIIMSVLLAMGPGLEFGRFQPWWILTDWIPGIAKVRNVFRFAYLTQMAIIVLSIMGLTELRVYLLVMGLRSWKVGIILLALACVALIEVPSPKVIAAGVPDLKMHQEWASYVKEKCHDGTGILCLPLPASMKADDFDFTARWMYIGTLHGIPMANGYSGFFPAEYLQMQNVINNEGVSEQVLSKLSGMQIQFLVVHDSYRELSRTMTQSDNGHWMEPVFESSSGIRVFSIRHSRPNDF